MLKEERQKHILKVLQTQGKLVATELSRQFEVSEDTIRRDLHDLETAGHIQRVHGGGLPRSPAAVSFNERAKQSPEAKAHLARAALEWIGDGQTIFMDGGTTNLFLAHALPLSLHATIITNSPSIVLALVDHPAVEVILAGGSFDKARWVTKGVTALELFRTIRADLCFLGVCGLHPDVGVSNDDYEENLVKRAMVHNATEVVVMVSAEKMGTALPYVTSPIEGVQGLITEKGIPQEELEPYRRAGLRVVQV